MSAPRVTRFGATLGIVLAALAVWATIVASAVPYTPAGADGALLRISLRLSAEGTETCRTPTEEEQAELPVHMRAQQICESEHLEYSLSVTVDGDTLAAETLQGRGARRDRPVSLLEEWQIDPGTHRIRVALDPSTGDGSLRLDQDVEVAAGSVTLVSIHPETGQLVLRQ